MASNHQYYKQGVVLVAAEGTYGTDAIHGQLGGSNAYTYLLVEECEITPVDELLPDDPIRQSFSGMPHSLMRKHCAVRMSGLLRGATNPGNAGGESPVTKPIFLSGGYASTVSSGVSDTWAPVTTQPGSFTLYRYLRNAEDGNYRMQYTTGVRGNWTITWAPGDYVRWEYEGLGLTWPSSSDTAAFKFWSDDLAFFNSAGKIILDKAGSAVVATSGTVQYDPGRPFKCESVTVTIDGATYPLSRLTLSPNRSAQANEDINSSGNIQSVYTMPTDRPGGGLQVAGTAAAYESFLAAWRDATEVDFSAAIDNGADVLTVATPGDNIQLYAPSRTDVSGKSEWGAEYRINGAWADAAGDDGHSIAWTASA